MKHTQRHAPVRTASRLAVRAALWYLFFAGSWLLISDAALATISGSEEQRSLPQLLIELIFVAISTVLVFTLIVRAELGSAGVATLPELWTPQGLHARGARAFASRHRSFLAAAAAFALAGVTGGTLIYLVQHEHFLENRRSAQELAADQGATIAERIARSLSATYALAVIIRQNKGQIANFEALAGDMLQVYEAISVLQLAPGGVISQSVPLNGNEKSIGHDLLADPKRNSEALLAVRTRALTLAGPFELIQGGAAVVGRMPVFVPDADNEERFWGFATALIRIPDLLKASHMLKLEHSGFRYELSRINPETLEKDLIARSISAVLVNPVSYDFQVPNGKWTLRVEPVAGWYHWNELAWEIALVLLVSAICAVTASTLAGQPETLRRLVAQRTGELQQANQSLTLKINEHLVAEAALQHALSIIDSTLQSTADGILVVDAAGDVVKYNARFQELWRIADPLAQDLGSGSPLAAVMAQLRAAEAFSIERVDGDEKPEIVNYDDLELADGRVIEWNSSPHRVAGNTVGQVLSFRDVTERTKAVAALRLRDQQMRILIDSIPAQISFIDADRRYQYFNSTLSTWFGLEAEQIRGRHMRDVLGEEVYAAVKPRVEQALGGAEVTFERMQRIVDGRTLHLAVHYVPHFRDDGEVIGFYALLSDITQIKSHETLLRKLSCAIEQSPVSVVISDCDGRIEYVNPKFTDLTGYRPGEVIGQNPRILKSENTPAHVYREMWEMIRAGGTWSGDIQNRKKNGELFWENLVISPITDDGGRITNYIAVKEDISERKRSEHSLQKLNRTLRMLSECNEALVHAPSESALLESICREIVETGGHRMAWVGFAAEDPSASIRPVAHAGDADGFLEAVQLSWADVPAGQGTCGTAIRTGAVAIIHDLAGDASALLWRTQALRRGFASAIGLPLKEDGRTFGSLNIYSGDAHTFDADEVRLLNELAEDLGYGIVSLRARAERQRMVAALEESEERFRSISVSAQDAIVMMDEGGRISYWNPAAERMFGYSAEEALGRNLHTLIAPTQSDAKFMRNFDNFRASGSGSIIGKMQEFLALRRDGVKFPIELSVSSVLLRGQQHAVGIIRDTTERKSHLDRIEHQANHDILTGLPNRNLLKDRLQQAITRADRRGQQVAVLFVDLDHFKLVNDSLGHGAGDELLKVVAERLMVCLRRSDTVVRFGSETIARFGGDEFVLILSEADSEEGLNIVMQRILSEISSPILVGGTEIVVTTCIGASVYPKDGKDADTILKNADIAMYRAKEGGRNAYRFFTDDMNARAFERLSIESKMRRALVRNELFLEYQPQFDVAGKRVIGIEALIRWQHPEHGLVAPSRFISVAEQSGMIVPIGDWVLREACAQNRRWQEAGLPPVTMAVNLSAVQFRRKNLTESIAQILCETGLPPRYLELEITESAIMQDAEEVVQTLHELKALGVMLSIDDFGTGYSSLSYLKRFSVDKLKIDMSFISGITTDKDDLAITSAIITIGHALRLRVIAEGVETAEQLASLALEGCDEIQGYLFSKPLAAQDCTRFLDQLRD